MKIRIANRVPLAMRKVYSSAWALLICVGAMVCIAPQCNAAGIGVTINGSPVDFAGMGPVQVNGRVLVPVRGVLESMGVDVGWTEETQTVVASNGHVDIQLRVGDHSASVDGQSVDLDVPAQVIAGHTMVPLRFLSQALGAEVHWNEQARLVEIVTNRKDGPVRPHRTDQDRNDHPDRGNKSPRRDNNRGHDNGQQ